MQETHTVPKNDPRTINAWALFDWANSVYFLVIATAVFPIYYTAITTDTIRVFGYDVPDSALFSYAVSFAYIVLALFSPLLAGMADYSGRRKRFLKIFTTTGAVACMAMFFFTGADLVALGTTAFIFATIGAAGGLVFYDAYLPEIATEDAIDKVSAKGYALGYIGSVLLLVFCLLMINFPGWFGIHSETLPARLSFVLVGIWWIGFAQIAFRRLPQDRPRPYTSQLFRKGYQEVLEVWHVVRKKSSIIRFLIAFFFYNAGVLTVIYLATIFAQDELEFDTGELILVVLILQLVAVAGAYLFAYVSKLIGNKASLLIQNGIWIVICGAAYFVKDQLHFYILAGMVGMVLGGIQSLSRATYAKLLQDTTTEVTSYFSFFDVLNKVSLVAGTFLFGLIVHVTGDMRNSVLMLAVFFIIGMIVLYTVDMRRMQPGEK